MSSSLQSRHHAQRMSPFSRQQLLVKRLSLTARQQQRQKMANYDSHAAAGKSISRKRPFPSIVQSAPSPPKIGSDVTDGGDINSNDPVINVIDEYETWEEVSTIIPLLTYGEESNALLSALLDFHTSSAPLNGSKCEQCNGELITDDHIQRRRQQIRSNFDHALDQMLRVRSIMRRRAYKTAEKGSSTPLPKKQRLSKEQKQPLTPVLF